MLSIKRDSDGLSFDWNALDALKQVQQESGLKVAHAAEWARAYVPCISRPSTLRIDKVHFE